MKRVIVMGASSGIGYAFAEALASRGVKVGVAARHTEKMVALKEKYPEFVEYMSIDITDPDAKERLHTLIAMLGGMDIYFHVSGIGYENIYLDPEREVEMINTNAAGFARMVCTAYRYFRDNGNKGQIAAVTSVAGTKGIGRMAAYSSTKKFDQWYLNALEQLSNAENAGISFTDIRPGWVRTPLIPDDKKFPMEMTVEQILPGIIKAIVKKERVAVLDWRWNLLVGAWRSIPNVIWTHMDVSLSTPDSPLPTEAQQELHDEEEALGEII